MSDVVVTVPKNFRYPDAPGKVGFDAWMAEGDPPGSEWSGNYYHFTLGKGKPVIEPGERVYVVCEGKLRGYAPLVQLIQNEDGRWELWRAGGAVAVTLDIKITGFQGFRYRWWEREEEIPIQKDATKRKRNPIMPGIFTEENVDDPEEPVKKKKRSG